MRGKLVLPAVLVVTALQAGCGGEDGPPDSCVFYCQPEPAIVDAGPLDPDARADCPDEACYPGDCPIGCVLG